MAFNKKRLLLAIAILTIIFTTPWVYAETVNIPSLLLSLKIEGDPQKVWSDKGKILYKLMAYKEAIKAFSQVGKDAPLDIMEEPLYLKANSLMRIGDYLDALTVLDSIPAKSRFYAYGLYSKSMISLHAKREDDAIEYLEQVARNFQSSQTIKGKERSPLEDLALKAHLTLGFIYLERNNWVEAIKHLSVIPDDSPFYMQALFGSGWAYAGLDRWVRTVVFWEELSYLYPESRYTREVMPYIGHAYATLSAYGKALEQNGAALGYYKDMLKRITEIEKEIKGKDIKAIAKGLEIIGDEDLISQFDLYNGLLSMEEYLGGAGAGVIYEIDALINSSKKERDKIIDTLSERLILEIADLRQQLSETSATISLEIARNLRLEGGGHISNDMIFDGP